MYWKYFTTENYQEKACFSEWQINAINDAGLLWPTNKSSDNNLDNASAIFY